MKQISLKERAEFIMKSSQEFIRDVNHNTLSFEEELVISAIPFNFNRLLDILDEIAVLERRQEQYAMVIKDLFEEDEKE
jgi:hypothetical protein